MAGPIDLPDINRRTTCLLQGDSPWLVTALDQRHGDGRAAAHGSGSVAVLQCFRRLPEVLLADEPEGCESWLESWALGGRPASRQWTDAYLAAFARAGGFRFVTFDEGFTRFEGLDLLHLKSVALPPPPPEDH